MARDPRRRLIRVTITWNCPKPEIFVMGKKSQKTARRGPYAQFSERKWPLAWKPDVVANITTKLGESVVWESMGTVSRKPRGRHGRTMQYQPRFPRAFMCTLKNNSGSASTEAFYDLYDVGAQRNKDVVEVQITLATSYRFEVSPDQPSAPLPVQNTSTGTWTLSPGGYQTGGPKTPAILRFTGSKCVLQIVRTAWPLIGDDSDGSPPPPDPGDDSDQYPLAKGKNIRRRSGRGGRK